MAVLGFKKTFAAGTISTVAISALFVTIKTYIVNAGFTTHINSATAIDFSLPGDTADDDTPHWAIELWTAPDNSANGLMLYAVKGADYVTAGSFGDMALGTFSGFPNTPIEVYFVADGKHGGFTLAAKSSTVPWWGPMYTGGVTKRYGSDLNNGNVARHFMLSGNGFYGCRPAFLRMSDGTVTSGNVRFDAFSPIGKVNAAPRTRHAGSLFGRCHAPMFPVPDFGTYGVVGEFQNLMALTDGYTFLEQVAPGFVAFPGEGDSTYPPIAIAAPTTFDVV